MAKYKKSKLWKFFAFVVTILILLALVSLMLNAYIPTLDILMWIAFNNALVYKIIVTVLGVVGVINLFMILIDWFT